MCEEKPSNKSEAIVSGLWLLIGIVLAFYFLETKTVIDGIAQDYPSCGMSLLKWAPLLFPHPSAYILIRTNFINYKKYLDTIIVLLCLAILYSIIKIHLTGSISWEMFKGDVIRYAFYISLGSLLILPKLKQNVAKKIDRTTGWK
jgi:hypothetical protein